MKRSKRKLTNHKKNANISNMNMQANNYDSNNAINFVSNNTKNITADAKELSKQLLNEEQQLLLETQKQLLALLNMNPEDLNKL